LYICPVNKQKEATPNSGRKRPQALTTSNEAQAGRKAKNLGAGNEEFGEATKRTKTTYHEKHKAHPRTLGTTPKA